MNIYVYREQVILYIRQNIEKVCTDNGCRTCEENMKKNYGHSTKHIASCVFALKQVALAKRELIINYCLEQRRLGSATKLSQNTIDELLGFLNYEREVNVVPIVNSQSDVIYSECVQDFLSFSLSVPNPLNFPNKKGIYLIRFLNNNKWDTLYIGRSIDLKQRWAQHHRSNEIQILEKIGIQLEYRYLAETSLMKFDKSLEEIERILIEAFAPKLNNSPILSIAS